jgi:hypothetical protein
MRVQTSRRAPTLRKATMREYLFPEPVLPTFTLCEKLLDGKFSLTRITKATASVGLMLGPAVLLKEHSLMSTINLASSTLTMKFSQRILVTTFWFVAVTMRLSQVAQDISLVIGKMKDIFLLTECLCNPHNMMNTAACIQHHCIIKMLKAK